MNIFKQLVIFAGILFCGIQANFAQRVDQGYLWPMNIPIPLYDTPTSYTPSTYIVQGLYDEGWYDVEILDTSDLRFKVKIVTLFSDGNIFCKPMWINKTDVAINVGADGFDDKGRYVILYLDKELSKSQKIYKEEIPQEVTLLEYDTINGERYAKIMFSIDDVIYIGWISHYCSNGWQSC